MSTSFAQLRHRELTQEIYNIGDEVAGYLENLMEAISDWDVELVEDCLTEFEEIVAEARDDSRTVVAELIGLRHALTAGLRQGSMSAWLPTRCDITQPATIDAIGLQETHPVAEGLIVVRDLAAAVNARTEAVIEHMEHIVEWVLAQSENVANDLDSHSLPLLYGRVAVDIKDSVAAWMDAVVTPYPAYVRTMRGSNPPRFLMERARIDAVVARVAAKLAKKQDAVS